MYASNAVDCASCSVMAFCACAASERAGLTRKLKNKAAVVLIMLLFMSGQVRDHWVIQSATQGKGLICVKDEPDSAGPFVGMMSDNGMVRPCSCPTSKRRLCGAPKTRSTPCLRQHRQRLP